MSGIEDPTYNFFIFMVETNQTRLITHVDLTASHGYRILFL